MNSRYNKPQVTKSNNKNDDKTATTAWKQEKKNKPYEWIHAPVCDGNTSISKVK